MKRLNLLDVPKLKMRRLVCPLFFIKIQLVSKKCPLWRVPYKRNWVYTSLALLISHLVSRSKSMILPSLFQNTVGWGDPLGGAQSNTARPPSCTPTSAGSRRNLSFKTGRKMIMGIQPSGQEVTHLVTISPTFHHRMSIVLYCISHRYEWAFGIVTPEPNYTDSCNLSWGFLVSQVNLFLTHQSQIFSHQINSKMNNANLSV